MKKRFAVVILCVFMLIGLFPSGAMASEVVESGTFDGNTWELKEDGTLTISGAGVLGEYTNPPWSSYMGSLRNIVIQPGFTAVEADAFYGKTYEEHSIESVSIPASVTHIGAGLFNVHNEAANGRYHTYRNSYGRIPEITFGGTREQWESLHYQWMVFEDFEQTAKNMSQSSRSERPYDIRFSITIPAVHCSDGDISNECVITLDPCDGSGSFETEMVKAGTAYFLPSRYSSAPEGAVFSYWIYNGLNQDGWRSLGMYPGNVIPVIGDMKFEARWTRYEDTYVNRVTWYDQEGAVLDTKDYAEGEPEPKTDEVPSIERNSRYIYEFTGWKVPSGGGGGVGYALPRVPVRTSGGGGIVTVQRTIVQEYTDYEPVFRAVPIDGNASNIVENVLNGGVCGPVGDEDSIIWTLTEDGTLAISGSSSIPDHTSPWQNNQGSVQSVVLSDGVTGVGENVLSNIFSLLSVKIPASVTALGVSAFSNCVNLVNVYYGGTTAQWEALTANEAYNLKNATVHCADGTLNFQYFVSFNDVFNNAGREYTETIVTCTNPDTTILCAAYLADGRMMLSDVQKASETGKNRFRFETAVESYDYVCAVILDEAMRPLLRWDSKGNIAWAEGVGGGYGMPAYYP